MTGVLVKLSRNALVLNLRQKAKIMFSSKYLLLTNTAISMGFSGTGDIMQQRYEKMIGKRSKWDPIRTANITSSGIVVGPLCHFWYQFLDRALPGKAVRVVLQKVVVDTLVISPVCVLSFLACVGYSEGASANKLKQDMTDKGPALLKAEILVWPPLQLINFFLLPTKYRVLYDNTVSLGFDNFYSYVKYGEEVQMAEDLYEDPDDQLEVHLEHTCINSRILHL